MFGEVPLARDPQLVIICHAMNPQLADHATPNYRSRRWSVVIPAIGRIPASSETSPKTPPGMRTLDNLGVCALSTYSRNVESPCRRRLTRAWC